MLQRHCAELLMKRGDTFIAYPDQRPAHRLFVSVTRVAQDNSWADIACSTWSMYWRKRQRLREGAFTFPHKAIDKWTLEDLDLQEQDWEAERGLSCNS